MAPKILVADDEESVRGLLRRALPPGRYDVRCASTGAEALESVRRDEPDLILLDVHMPDRDGLEVLRELRRDARTRLLPVILLTGDGGSDDRVRGLERGADDYVSKPFDLGELAARVGGLLRRSRRDVGANPLTRLPGSPSIQEEVERRLGAFEPFAFLYIDLDRFKAYNDARGYAEGDALILKTAELLSATARAEDPDHGFVGHVGGDDFAVICAPERAENLARSVAERFERVARALGSAPRVSISIAGVSTARRYLARYEEAVCAAAAVKARLKTRAGDGISRYAFAPRRPE